MGAAKLLIEIDGKAMVRHAADAAHRAELPLLAIVADADGPVITALSGERIVVATDAEIGISATLRAGLDAAPAEWAGALVLLGDMPFVQPATLRSLAEELLRHDVVAPLRGDRRGNPIGWSRRWWPALCALDGDRGGGVLIDQGDVVPRLVAVDDPGVLIDIDTPADLARWWPRRDSNTQPLA